MAVNEVSQAHFQAVTPKTGASAQPELWQRELEKASGAKAPQATPKSPSEILTKAEQAYFEELFPSSGPDLKAHAMYRQDGSASATALGTVVDRKG
ncbi:MAG TPA: hypothetical protein VMG34_05275 [Bacteroidota bacterium]|nr:hypothetical protein [Bacteroidota bacterium]